MMVTFISQCQKKSLQKTRQVLDAFADRIGDNAWQTVITEDGLLAVKKMLRQTASKNTAVACHWIRSRSRSDLLWVVGNKNQFDEVGRVPVNETEKDLGQFMDDDRWQTINDISYASAIAAMFHDFGKANYLFQNKIDPQINGDFSEPYRHEWVSMRLFQAFVGERSDEQWLKALCQIDKDQDIICYRDGIDGGITKNHPLQKLPPFAMLVAWLILTHHKLPSYPWNENSPPDIKNANNWLERAFDSKWNSPNCKDEDKTIRLNQNWLFEIGLPNKSMQWRSKVCLLTSEALNRLHLTSTDYLHEQLFTSHIARMCLMLGDHYYSSQKNVNKEWQNEAYNVFANTDANILKQKLDEHLIGVAHNTFEIAKKLPRINGSLKQLERNIALESDVSKQYEEKFGWQNNARKLAIKIGDETRITGFFGINMASTGTGKTQANAKIMYAIGQANGRTRFSVALGLRTLTLQTGKEYRERLEIDEEDLAILVGGQAVKQLFENEQKKNPPILNDNEKKIETGSESENLFFDDGIQINYTKKLEKHSLSQWTSHDPRIEKLLQAPVLVSTIDHLIPASEGIRGGKQIAPMLRLLTSDLVLDEPDDFGLEDLPALCRLVHWAAMLGCRVLLSTATMPPALAFALFEAYYAGWKEYAKANIPTWDNNIVCAWFDEFSCVDFRHSDFVDYQKSHNKFVKTRVKNLTNMYPAKRKGYIAQIETQKVSIIENLGHTIHQNLLKLHQAHHISKNGKSISIGLVRMANIKPLVAVAKQLLQFDSPENTIIHYCIYHSQFPLAIRSHLESKLDTILKRHDSDLIWQQCDILPVLSKHPEDNHVFVVLASPVAEVGRDHDYDWAIVEPSSMRSIVQLAGRILRHRNTIPKEPNICILNQNYKSLLQKEVCFDRPGFESSTLKFVNSHKLEDLIPKEYYETISSIPKIMLPEMVGDLNFINLEHKATGVTLFGERNEEKKHGGARVWWKEYPQWCGEVQRQQKFRDSKQDEAYCLFIKNEDEKEVWKWRNENVSPSKLCEPLCEIKNLDFKINGLGCTFWFDLVAKKIYGTLASDFEMEFSEISERFGEIRLTQFEDNMTTYCYHINLGVFEEV